MRAMPTFALLKDVEWSGRILNGMEGLSMLWKDYVWYGRMLCAKEKNECYGRMLCFMKGVPCYGRTLCLLKGSHGVGPEVQGVHSLLAGAFWDLC